MAGRLRLTLTVSFLVLSVATVLAFLAFDRHSHSASDTLRPFLITMLPMWAIVIAAALALRR